MSATAVDTPTASTGSRRKAKGAEAFGDTRRRLTSPGATIAAIVIAVLWTIPTFGLFVTSFRQPDDITTSGWWTALFHPDFTLNNYVQTINFQDTTSVGQAFLNSFVIVIPATLIPIAIAALAAYALAWIPFRGRAVLFTCIFAMQVVPIQLTLVPLLKLMSDGLTVGGFAVFPGLNLNSLDGSFARLWIAHTIYALPLAIFMLHNSISGLPNDLMEAARMDGAGHGQIFLRIVLPLSMPALASFTIFQFIWVWNDLLVATIFTSGSNFPITYIINDLSGKYGATWYLLSAGTFIGIVVPLVVFFALQRFFVRGLLAGATKG